MSKKAKSQSKKSTKKTAPAKAETVVIEVAASAVPATPGAPDARLPPPGTLLQKLDRHGAVRCECSIEEGGIRYAGNLYRSISAAAMAAAKDLGLANKTQNGFSFWSLTKPSRPPKDPLQALERVWERYHGQVETIAKGATEENRSQVTAAIWEHAQGNEDFLRNEGPFGP